jgi:C-terminal processing protease CtpA/Prc
MQKIFRICFVLWIFLSGPVFSQTTSNSPFDAYHEFDAGSRIRVDQLSAVQIENLAVLGKVWGFLKYHHRVVTGGQRQWDYELLRVMPTILAATDRQSANVVLEKWVAGVGPAFACQPCASLNLADIQSLPRLQWLETDTTLSVSLRDALRQIYKNRSDVDEQFYVAQVPGIGNPKFIHELEYKQLAFPDSGFQLLSLFRFWNIVEYWAPYRDQIGEDWDGVLRQSIAKIALAKDRAGYELQMMALIARIHDTHANLWSALGVRPPVGACSLPVIVRFIEGHAVVTAYADNESGKASGLQVGDIIDSIDGHAVDELVGAWRPYYAASNDVTQLRDIARGFGAGACGPSKVQVRRATGAQVVDATRLPGELMRRPSSHDRPGDTFQLLSEDIAYVKLSSIKQSEIAVYMKLAEKTKGLIIDIRNYPSDFVPFALGQYLVSKPTDFVRFSVGDLRNPGAFRWGPQLAIQPRQPYYDGKVMILLDETSQSQSEYTAMALRTGARAQVVGSTTAGADGNVSSIALPGGLRSAISGIGVFYPDKRPTQRVGIIPDIEVRPTIRGVREGRDEVLDAAIVHIRKD